MISKHAVREYLDRPFEDHRWLKECTRRELIAAIKDTRPSGFKFKVKPFHHQLVSLWLAVCYPGFLFTLDMGLGKSKVMLDAFEWHRRASGAQRMLVLVPNSVNLYTWAEQVEQHSFFRCAHPDGRAKDWLDQIPDIDAEVFVITYAGLQAMVCERGRKKTKTRGGVLKPDAARVKRLASMFDMVVYDEVHRAKDHNSLTFRVCSMLSRHVQFRYGLTGTPFARDPGAYWAELYLVDLGQTLGSAYGFFREVFYRQHLRQARFNTWMEYKFDRRMGTRLHRMVQHRSIRYADSECRDMPALHHVVRKLPAQDVLLNYHAEVRSRAADARKDRNRLEGAFMRMRQIASGFMYLKDESDGGRDVVSLVDDKNNVKLQALEGLLEKLPVGESMVVFHEFIQSGHMIANLLNRMHVQHIRLPGAKQEDIIRFKQDPQVRVMVANSKSGSVGGNFQHARYMVFFESPVSPIDRSQAEKRCYGRGEKKRMHIYDLAIQDSVEERILAFLKDGKDLFKAIVEGKEKL